MPAILRSDSELHLLTPTQKRVVALNSAGRSNRVAAQELGIQPGTLARHVRSIGSKFGVTGRPAMVHVVLAIGQIPAPKAPADVPGFTAADLQHMDLSSVPRPSGAWAMP